MLLNLYHVRYLIFCEWQFTDNKIIWEAVQYEPPGWSQPLYVGDKYFRMYEYHGSD